MIGKRIRQIIDELKITQKKFANELGLTDNYIAKLIGGFNDKISETAALLIQEKYGYSAKWITSGEGERLISQKNSFVKQRTISAIKSLSDQEVQAVIAFVNSMEDLKKVFGAVQKHDTACVAEEDSAYNTKRTICIMGRVAGGKPILAIEDGTRTVETYIKCDGALELVGDSMEPDYRDGDILLVVKQEDLENGELGIIMRFDGAEIAEATFKRFYRDNDRIILKSTNKNHPDQIWSRVDARIYGKVVGKV